MSLISGKEALEKVTTGQVQYMHSSETQNRWTTITDHYYPQYNLGMFLDHDTEFKFRLKPQTITINGIEVPKPDYIVDTPHDYDGWEIKIGGVYYLFETEENYKQVVEALRQIFK